MLCVLEASAQKGIARKLQSCVVNAVCSDIFIQEGETGSQQTKELQTKTERKRKGNEGEELQERCVFISFKGKVLLVKSEMGPKFKGQTV